MRKKINVRKETRPWGKYELFALNEKATVKILTVLPREKLSLQKHKKRSEFWKFLDNPAKVTVGNRTFRVKKDDEIFISENEFHRIEAYSKPVRVLEISFGHFRESDIERADDKYGRK